MERVIFKNPTKKIPGSNGLTHEFYQAFKELTLIKVFQKIKYEEIFPNLF